jgi:beta-lactamase regulating signal transducer with metallopeptidase domain
LCTLEDEDGSNRLFHVQTTTTQHPKKSPTLDEVPVTAASDKINDNNNHTTVFLEGEAGSLQQHGSRQDSTSSYADDRTKRAVLSFAVVVMITTLLFLVVRHRRRERQRGTAQPLENASYETLEANMDSETEYDAENV